MKSKRIILLLVILLAAISTPAYADTILFPTLVKSTSSVVTLVSVMNDSDQASYLKYIYRHKDGAADISVGCGSTALVRSTFGHDLVSFDVSGTFNAGNALFNDGGSYGGSFALTDSGARRAYLLVTHSDSAGNRVDVGNSQSLKGEAIIMDIVGGAAWGYKAINDKDREDYTFTASGTYSAMSNGEGSALAFFPSGDWTTKVFVTPIGTNMDTASLAGQVNLSTIYDRNGQVVTTGVSKGLACLGVLNVFDFMDATSQAILAPTGGWSYFTNEGSNPVVAYKLEYVLNNPTYGGTNNNGYCLSCDKEALTPASGKTWTISNIPDLSAAYSITLTTNPSARTIALSFTSTQGAPSVCYFETFFVQGGQQFNLSTNPNIVNASTALFVPDGGWSGCTQIGTGVTKTGTVQSIPSWFNFNLPFTFSYECDLSTCEQVLQ
ncbi:MAG: hypothetical protein ACLPX5_12530 [Dissulfurispiraceae bacterium]